MKNQMQTQKGFTLIELMIVIAIIGILASIAIPQYQIYTQRTQATTAIAGVRTVQLAIQEHYSTLGVLPDAIADLSPFGITQAELDDVANSSDTLSAVAYASPGTITLTYTAAAGNDLDGATLIISPQVTGGVVVFGIDPTSAATAGTVEAKFRPKLPEVTAAAAP